MPALLVLGDVTVDVSGRALLVVPVAAAAGPDDHERLTAAAAAGIDVLELDAGDGHGGPLLEAGAVGARVDVVRRAARLPVVVRTTRPDVVAATRAGGGAAVDVRAAWSAPDLVDEVARSGLVVVVAGPTIPVPGRNERMEPPPAVAAAAAGVPSARLVVDTGTVPAAAAAAAGRSVPAWSVDPGVGTGPRALAEAAVAIVRGVRWLRVPAPDGFRQVRDTLAAVEAADGGRTGVTG